MSETAQSGDKEISQFLVLSILRPEAGTPASGPKTTGGHDAVGMMPAVLRYNATHHTIAGQQSHFRRQCDTAGATNF